MMDIIIVGGGKVGTHLASLLMAEGYAVKLIENQSEKIPRLLSILSPGRVIHGDGTDPELLKTADIQKANVVVAVTGSDETNLVITSLARFEFKISRTIARVNDPKNAWLYTQVMGVDVSLNQADLIAHLIIEQMSLGEMMTMLKLSRGQYSLVEIQIDATSEAAGKAVSTLSLPQECVLVAVIRRGELIIPHGNTILEPQDEVLALVHISHASSLSAILGHEKTVD
jgi:trk system potassium uptake protein TrkA